MLTKRRIVTILLCLNAVSFGQVTEPLWPSPALCAQGTPISFFDGEKWGFLTSGGVAIEPQFDGVSRFQNDEASVRLGDQCARIDSAGRYVSGFHKCWNVRLPGFSEDLGRAQETPGGKFGYIDKSENIVLPFQYQWAHDFHDGLALVVQGNKFFFMDHSGQGVTPHFDWASEFYEGLAAVRLRGKMGYIRPDGTFAITPQFEFAIPFEFSEGVAPVLIGNKFGYINSKGKVEIAPAYQLAYPFSDGLALVQVGGLWGYIDHSGKFVIPLQYKQAFRFSESLAAVQIDSNKWGYIDKSGHFAIPPEFDSAQPFCAGLAEVGMLWMLQREQPSGRDQFRAKHAFIGVTGRYVWQREWGADDTSEIRENVNSDK